jgi:4-carboxymuconolactone decarboxylase
MTIKIFKPAILIIVLFINFNIKAHSQQQMTSPEQLTDKQQGLITISAFAAKGDLKNLESQFHASLDAKLSISEAKEAMMHLYAYAGFPRSLRGLQTLMKVTKDRSDKGIVDIQGAEASKIIDSASKYERGKQTLEKLTGVKETGPKTGYASFAPAIEVFLKEHLFADLFERDVLSYIDRELVTISVIAGIGEAEPMLSSHMNICLNLGLSPAQLQQFVELIKANLGAKEGAAAQGVLTQVLKNYKPKNNNGN